MATHFNLPSSHIDTVPASRGNAITKEYYDFLVGEINRGTIHKAVCRIEYPQFVDYGTGSIYTTYHLISV